MTTIFPYSAAMSTGSSIEPTWTTTADDPRGVRAGFVGPAIESLKASFVGARVIESVVSVLCTAILAVQSAA